MSKKWIVSTAFTLVSMCAMIACKTLNDSGNVAPVVGEQRETESSQTTEVPGSTAMPEDGFVLIKGGSFQMGSPESEAWRSDDEVQHPVTVSDFFMSSYEVTQGEYEKIIGVNPSNFFGDTLPVENVSWLEAITYCNAKSAQENLTPVYTIDGQNISWNREADGYRLPTEAEWEYACRAGTKTPFYMDPSPSAEDANYYGHYPYEIEGNYFAQDALETKPGEYRETTVEVGNFAPNPYGLYDMHGNVGEWVWDYYGSYPSEEQTDPTGPDSGVFRVYRGGGWNDFAKNMRSAYRATLEQDHKSFNLGFRLVRNAVSGSGSVAVEAAQHTEQDSGGKILIAYFSWGGEIQLALHRRSSSRQEQICLRLRWSSLIRTTIIRFWTKHSVIRKSRQGRHWLPMWKIWSSMIRCCWGTLTGGRLFLCPLHHFWKNMISPARQSFLSAVMAAVVSGRA